MYEQGLYALTRGDLERAHSLFQQILSQAPESDEAAYSIDYLLQLSGGQVLPEPEYTCTASAREEADKGDKLRYSGKLDEASRAYSRAIADCPSNASWRVQAGDIALSANDLTGARGLYESALGIDPWQREAHSRLGTVLERSGDAEGSFRQHVLSVVSDPTFEVGWLYLRKAAAARGGKLIRRFERKPETGKDGALIMYTDAAHPMSQSWMDYALSRRFSDVDGEKEATPFELERKSVIYVLEMNRSGDDSPFWRLASAAAKKSMTDEAIYMGLLDRELAPEFRAYRAKHADRLEKYVREVAIEWPGAGAAGKGKGGI